MNRLWRYFLGEIAKLQAPSSTEEKKEIDKKTKKAYNAKLC